MEAFAVTLTVAAAVIPAAALIVHAIAQLPKIPLVEASVTGILTAVAAVTLAELGADPLPSWAIALSMIAWLVFLLIFPSGRPTSAALTVAVVAASGVIAGGEWWEPLRLAVPYAFVLAFAAVSAGQIQRYARRSSIAERQSTKWLVLGLLPAIGVFLGLGIISLLPAAPPTMLEQPWYLTASTTAMWIVPIAATAGILLDDRGPIDELIRFAIAATGTAFVAAAAYVAALGLTRPEWAAATACATVVPAAWLFLQLGTALAYSRGPQRPLAAMPARLGSAAEPRDVGRVVAETTHAALGLPVVEVRVGGELLAKVGDDVPSVARTEVVFDGARVAELVVAPRPGETELTRRDRLILDRIAAAAAPALRAAFAAREADEARTHLETARADERRRLHADLHDELGPALAGLGFTARAASRTLAGERPEVADMLGSIESGTQSLVRRVREISYDLRAEELSGERLEAILEDRLRIADDSLRVRLDCDPVPDDLLPDILRIVLEAVTNVRRHAAARSCRVTVRADEPHRVRIDVTDDGSGTGHAATEGIGHASIRRRAEQHGGWVEFESSAGGSRLTAVLGAAEARSA
jgi:signal transduction histidine kinase